MRWLAFGAVLAALLTGLVRVAGPALLEPSDSATRWLLTALVAGVTALLCGLLLARAAVPERGWATLGLIAPGLLAQTVLADAFGSVFPALQATSDRSWAAMSFLVWGAVALTGFVMGRR